MDTDELMKLAEKSLASRESVFAGAYITKDGVAELRLTATITAPPRRFTLLRNKATNELRAMYRWPELGEVVEVPGPSDEWEIIKVEEHHDATKA